VIFQDHGGLFKSGRALRDRRLEGGDVHALHSHRWHGGLHQAHRSVPESSCLLRYYWTLEFVLFIWVVPLRLWCQLFICDLSLFGANSPVDDVFGQILHSSNEKLSEAKKILEKIVTRQHYRFLGEVKPTEVRTSGSVCLYYIQTCWPGHVTFAVVKFFF